MNKVATEFSQRTESRQKLVVLTGCASPLMRQLCLAAGAVFDKATEIDEFTDCAINEVERVAGRRGTELED